MSDPRDVEMAIDAKAKAEEPVDSDGDGVSDVDEVNLGTDPFSPGSGLTAGLATEATSGSAAGMGDEVVAGVRGDLVGHVVNEGTIFVDSGRAQPVGFADIRPGEPISLTGVNDRFSGGSLVTAEHHDIDGSTWDAGDGIFGSWSTPDQPEIVGSSATAVIGDAAPPGPGTAGPGSRLDASPALQDWSAGAMDPGRDSPGGLGGLPDRGARIVTGKDEGADPGLGSNPGLATGKDEGADPGLGSNPGLATGKDEGADPGLGSNPGLATGKDEGADPGLGSNPGLATGKDEGADPGYEDEDPGPPSPAAPEASTEAAPAPAPADDFSASVMGGLDEPMETSDSDAAPASATDLAPVVDYVDNAVTWGDTAFDPAAIDAPPDAIDVPQMDEPALEQVDLGPSPPEPPTDASDMDQVDVALP